ncbi:MAG TPA: SCO family protein [Gammaproteobacteria bacterium]|nr:SCO family protein [Gammaproteobacteria bacterium]
MQNTIPCRRHSLSVRAIIPMLLAAVWLTACSKPEPPQLRQGTLLPEAVAIADFQLTDQHGKPFTLDNLKGHWSFAFFGYTQCPDVCPTSLAMLARMLRKLEQSTVYTVPQVLFVSIDPERDTPEQLAEFVPYFHPDFIGLTGEPDQLQALTRQLGIHYNKAPPAIDPTNAGTDADNYEMDHSAAIALFDPAGGFRAAFGVPHDPGLIAQDFVAIKNYYEATR